jgi:hypothetical protein
MRPSRLLPAQPTSGCARSGCGLLREKVPGPASDLGPVSDSGPAGGGVAPLPAENVGGCFPPSPPPRRPAGCSHGPAAGRDRPSVRAGVGWLPGHGPARGWLTRCWMRRRVGRPAGRHVGACGCWRWACLPDGPRRRRGGWGLARRRCYRTCTTPGFWWAERPLRPFRVGPSRMAASWPGARRPDSAAALNLKSRPARRPDSESSGVGGRRPWTMTPRT